jgi:nickel-type superoxide dismutase maturation protease
MLLTRFTISGHSMQPTLMESDSVLVSSVPYIFSKPKVRDIIAFKDSKTKKVFIKRVTKVENDKYEVLGDNPLDSKDSRSFGWITKKDIIGKVIFET